MCFITNSPSSDTQAQAHNKKLVRSAAVNWNVRFGSFGILSELCLAHGITPDACVLSDKTDFKIDRTLYKSKRFPNCETGREQTGGSVCVKLLRLYSHSERKLTAIKQVRNVVSRVESGESHFPEVLSRIGAVETDFTPELGSRL